MAYHDAFNQNETHISGLYPQGPVCCLNIIWFSRLSVTIGQVAMAQSVAHSMASNKKTSTVSDQKSKGHHGSQVTAGKTGGAAVSSGDGTSQVRNTSLCKNYNMPNQ